MRFIPLDERTIKDEDVFSAFDLSLPGLGTVKKSLGPAGYFGGKKAINSLYGKKEVPSFLI